MILHDFYCIIFIRAYFLLESFFYNKLEKYFKKKLLWKEQKWYANYYY